MAWLAVDKDGTEKIFNVKPFKGNNYNRIRTKIILSFK